MFSSTILHHLLLFAAASEVNVFPRSYSPASEPFYGELHKHVLTIETVPPLDEDARSELYKQYQMQVGNH
jgi:hypothetical protein